MPYNNNNNNRTGHFKKSSAHKKRGHGNKNIPEPPTQPTSSYNTAILESEADFKRELALCRHEVNLLQSRASQWQNRYENVFTAYRVYKQKRTAIFHQSAATVTPKVDTSKKVEKPKPETASAAKPAQADEKMEEPFNGKAFLESIGLSDSSADDSASPATN